MRAAFDYLAGLEYQDLICTANGRQAVRNYKGGAATT